MRYQKRMLAILSIFLLLLTGCQSGSAQSSASTDPGSPITLQTGVLQIGTHIGYVPMEYMDASENLTGFDIELASLLAAELHLEPQVTSTAWDAIFKNLENHSYDAIISSVSYTKERDEKYALTIPYLTNGLVLVVPKDSTYKSITDLKNQCIGVQLATTAEALAKDYIKAGTNMELAQYENVTNAFDALKRGDVQGVCTDSVVAGFLLTQSDDYKIVWHSEESEPLCICVNKENDALQAQINEALQNLYKKGELQALSQKYFGTDYIPPIQ